MWPRWLSAVGCGLALAPVGCFLFPKPPTAIGRVQLDDAPADTAERVTFDTRQIEQPVGDDYLNRGLWREGADPLPHQTSALLAANGLRVQVISGQPSSTFSRLASAAAVAPTLRSGLAGKPKLIPVNGPLDRCTADVTDALTTDKRKVQLAAVECGVIATGTPTAGGRVTVRCQLLLRHGDKRPWWTATEDGGFERTDARTKEDFPPLVFEVSVGAKETLVIGPTADADNTLGGVFFFTADQAKQRVLVLQAKGEK